MSRNEFLVLGTILTGALLLRIPAIGWGLPPSIPEVAASDIRCSYSFDEDEVLTYVSFTNPAAFDFDPRLYQWGTLHLHLMLPWLEAAENVGYIRVPWRDAYYRMIPGNFERVYIAGRFLSIIFSLFSIALLFLLGVRYDSKEAGFWAALLMALSPAHLLASVQIRFDVTMVALVTLTALLVLRAHTAQRTASFFVVGAAAGLAVAAKYPAVFAVAPMVAMALWSRRFHWRYTIAALAGVGLGFLAGQPYVLFSWPEMVRQLERILRINREVPPEFLYSIPELLGLHALNVARFLLGPVAAALALWGLLRMVRGRSGPDLVLLAGLAGVIVSFIPLRWPLLRYDLPLLPFLCLAAGVALVRLPRAVRWPLGAAAAVFPLAASVAQLQYIRTPHPANQALAKILTTVPEGTAISRMAAELPPLDRKVYPMSLNPYLDDLSKEPPEWVLTANLPDRDYPKATRDLLGSRYDTIAEFRSPRVLSWATLGESGAPHDWKYTHPHMVLYRRRSP